MRAYNINLAIYCRYDTPGYDMLMDLTIILELGKPVILNRHKTDENTSNVDDSLDNGGKPALISGDQADVASSSTKSDSTSLQPEHPTHSQPYRSKKDYVVYYAMDSDSSSDELRPDKTHPDQEYIPPSLKGTLSQGMFHPNI